MYSDKLSELKTEGEPIKQRRLEFELRPGALDDFALAIQLTNKAVDLYRLVNSYSIYIKSEMFYLMCTSKLYLNI